MIYILRKARAIGLAAITSFAILAVGQGLWGVMAIANVKLTPAVPWAAVLMPLVLAALVLFLAGRIGPRSGRPARRALVPLAPVSGRAWAWSLIGGGLAVVAAAALWTVLASLVRTPPNLLPDPSGVPLWTGIPMLLVAIAAAPLSEEIAFRGYAMGFLSRAFGPVAALLITALLFAAAHLTQGLYAQKLLVYFLAGLAFGFVAWRTGSLLPAMAVHVFADLTFFTLVWSHDASRRLVTEGGADGWFWMNVALLVVATPLSLAACRELARGTPRSDGVPAAPARSELAAV
jgi:membrane protease YdiL (CAAX protease family)